MTTDKENRLFEKAALMAYNAHITEGTFKREQCARAAWKDAELFMEMRREIKIERLVETLNKLNKNDPEEAMRKIFEADGNRNRGVDFMIDLYKDSPDPLRAYAEDDKGSGKTIGQIAIMRYLKQQQETKGA